MGPVEYLTIKTCCSRSLATLKPGVLVCEPHLRHRGQDRRQLLCWWQCQGAWLGPNSFLLIAGPLMDYLPSWQKIYFYSWG